MYKISGFADEISSDTTIQFEAFNNLGIKYFEPRGIDGRNISDLTIEEAMALKEKMDKYGICASSIGSPIGKIDINDDFEEHKKKLLHTIKIAKILGASYIRIFSFYMKATECDKYRDEVMRRMTEMARLARENDIILLHENERGIYGDTPERCKDIFDTVKSPNLKAVFDCANFVLIGAETYPYAFELLKEHISYVHVKDAIFESESIVPAGYGEGHYAEITEVLGSAGYDGFYSMEPHLGSFEGLDKLELGDKLTKLPKAGIETFTLAFEAFEKILKEKTDKNTEKI